jgi:uncharacterized protein (DUF433 family)
MDWRDYIHSDKAILGGKPVFKGTRLPVQYILECRAEGWSEAKLLDQFPTLAADHLQAMYAYLAEVAADPVTLYAIHEQVPRR